MSEVAVDTVDTTAEVVQDPTQETSYSDFRASMDGTPKAEKAEPAPVVVEDKPAEPEPDRRPFRQPMRPVEDVAPVPEPEPEAAPTEPIPSEFVNDKGEFDGQAYAKAMAHYAKAEALRGVKEHQESERRAEAQRQHQESVRQIANEWNAEAEKFASRDDDIKASLTWLGSAEVVKHIPAPIQLEILQAHPLVGHVLASDQGLMDVLFSGDVRKSLQVISVLDDRVRQRLAAQASAPATPAASAPVRDERGQFAPQREAPPPVPVRATPKGPSDVGASSADSGGGSYKSYRERMLAKEARGEKTR